MNSGWIAFAVILAVGISPAIPAVDDVDTCQQQTGDVAIAVCRHVIASGTYKGSYLSALYYNRGNAYNVRAAVCLA